MDSESEKKIKRVRSTQFGEGSINGQSNRGKVGLTLKSD